MGFLYYAVAFGWQYILRYPLHVAAGIAVFLLARRLLPYVYLHTRSARRVRSLELQIAQNADNATARRDLASVWLDRKRPRRAIPLLEEAHRRAPDSADIAFLLALAYVRAGEPEAALPFCIEAAERDPKLRYGEVYLVAGIALSELERDAEAEDALLRHLKINASSVQGWVRLAGLRRKLGDANGAKAALTGAVEAFQQSPRFARRRELGWYVRGRLGALLG